MTAPSQTLLELSCEVCWRQWTALGVSGVKRPESTAVVDLEALVVFTAGLGDADPRLRDEATDWCVQYGSRFISTSRLRNLLKAEPTGRNGPVAEFLATVNAHSSTGWPIPGSAKPRRVTLSGKSRLPDPRKRPELLRLQLRALFGNTARAEVLLGFLTTRPSPPVFLSATDLAGAGYSKRNLAFVLDDLSLAGLLTERKVSNQLRYRLERRAELIQLAPGAQSAILTRWDLRFRALSAAHSHLAATASKSATVRSIATSRLVGDLSTIWDALDLTPPAPADPTRYQDDLTSWLSQELIPPSLR